MTCITWGGPSLSRKWRDAERGERRICRLVAEGDDSRMNGRKGSRWCSPGDRQGPLL